MHKKFPNTLGFGKVFKDKDGYSMHQKRCPDPRDFQDCVFWTLLSFLDQWKSKKKSTLLSDTKGNTSKPRKATQVIQIASKGYPKVR